MKDTEKTFLPKLQSHATILVWQTLIKGKTSDSVPGAGRKNDELQTRCTRRLSE